jgi:serine/threonine protein phosphatase PrpC
MEEGDFIVLGTDGLWDNLNDDILIMNISKIKVFFFQILLFFGQHWE